MSRNCWKCIHRFDRERKTTCQILRVTTPMQINNGIPLHNTYNGLRSSSTPQKFDGDLVKIYRRPKRATQV
ncbi:Bifunctional purine biosynthesis protein PurH [Trichinella spiralis]|uniref:Bifunctional purine biosynthesis protein PurH n=2 Tax=Trichinella spiralis TaxID=6334 RepID=A0ABR3KAE3_TRISP